MYLRFLALLRSIALTATIVNAAVATDILAADDLVAKGNRLAQENCSRCHAIGPRGRSPLREAPPFRTLHERYPVEQLGEAFAEGIVVGHTAMPNFVLQPTQIAALVAYLETLE